MKVAYEYLLTDGNRGESDFTENDEFHKFLKEHKKKLDTITATLDDGRKFCYERQKGWYEIDTPF